MNLLITSIHAHQAYSILRALRPYAAKVIVSTYPTPDLLSRWPHGAFSRLIDKRYAVTSPVPDWQAGNVRPENTPAEEAYVTDMLEICFAENIDVIYPTWDPDVYLLSKNKSRFAERGVLIPIPDFEVTLTALDKYRTVEAACAIGFPCPRTRLYESVDDVRAIAEELGFPLVIKRRFTSGSRGLHIVRDLPSLLDRLSFEANGRYKPIIQEYIPSGQRESVQFVFDQAGNPAFLFHKKRVRNFRIDQRFGTVSRAADLPDYCPDVLRLMQSIGWWAAGGIEVMRDPRDGAWKIMEINARYPRQLWNRTELGINEPLMSLEIARGKIYSSQVDYPKDVLFVNPVEDFMLLCLQLLDRAAYRLRGLAGSTPLIDPSLAPPPMSTVLQGFFDSYTRARKRVFDPYLRHFFSDPLVALLSWLHFATWIGSACRRLGR
jgi:biotin carboxylase